MESTDLVTNQFNVIKNKENLKKEGDKVLETNHFFQDLTELMEDEKFLKFFEKWMCSWSEIKSTVIYMKLYKEFKDKYREISNKELDKSITTFILCKIMRDKSLRSFSIKKIDQYYEKGISKKKDFMKDLEVFLENKKKLLLENN